MTKNWFLKLVETEIKSNQALKTQDSSLRGDSTICWPMMIKKLNEHLKQNIIYRKNLLTVNHNKLWSLITDVSRCTGRLTFPLHLSLLMIFRAYSLPVDLSTHSLTTAKFPSPNVLPTLYLSAMEAGTEGNSSIGSAVVQNKRTI